MLKLRITVSFWVIMCVLSSHVTSADIDGSASLLYCNGKDIRSFNLSSHHDSTLKYGIPRPGVVDYHFKNKVFFWTDISYNINRAPLWQEGAQPSVLIRGVLSYGLAVDWMHNLLYWASYGNGAVEVARLDGSMTRTLIKEKSIRPWAIVLNPTEGFMIWSDYGNIDKIERCSMDGSNREVIVKDDIFSPYSLAIDLSSRRIFWVDAYKGYLSSSKFDGNHRRNLITQLKVPHSIDVYGQYVYFVTRQSNHEAIYKASKVDGSGLTKVLDGERELRSLKVFDPSKQSEGFNVCGDNNGGCSHLCLPTSDHTFSCACPNDRNMSGDNFNCLNPDGSAVTIPISTSTSSQRPFTVIKPNFTSSTVTTPSSTTNSASEEFSLTVTRNNFTTGVLSTEVTTTVNLKKSDEDIRASFIEDNINKNVATTPGSPGIHGTLTVVIASVTFIAVVGMMIYFRKFLIKITATADTKNLMGKKNAEDNMYMEAFS